MFGLTPRSNSPKNIKPHSVAVNAPEAWESPSDTERRLASELEKVLAKKIPPHRDTQEIDVKGVHAEPANSPTAFHKTFAGHDYLYELDADDSEGEAGETFRWIENLSDGSQTKSGQSQIWLKRAKRQETLHKVRMFLLVAIGAATLSSLIVLAIWPSIT